MNEMITCAVKFIMGKNGWNRERQVEINTTREQSPSCFC